MSRLERNVSSLVDQKSVMEEVVQQLVNDPDFTIRTTSFPSLLLDEMVEHILGIQIDGLDSDSVSVAINNVAIEEWVNRMKPKSCKDVKLSFFIDCDVIAIELYRIDGSKIGCTSFLSERVVASILEFLESREVRVSLYKPTLAEIVEEVHSFLRRRAR